MTQDIVTATDIAAPAAGHPQLPDAQLVCNRLNDALVAEGFDRANYSPAVRFLFQQAWAVASHKRNTQVTVYHLAYALVFNNPEAGNKLAEQLGSDVDTFAVGCILQILPLGVSTSDHEVLAPAVGMVRWVGHAVALTRVRREKRELLPEDLVQVVMDGDITDAERGALKKAARVGNARHDAVLGQRPAQSIMEAPAASRDIIKHMEEVERGQPPESVLFANLISRLDEFEERQTSELARQKKSLTQMESAITSQLADIGQRADPDLHIVNRLDAIDGRVSALHEALPRPPSALRVAAAIVAVLTLGVGAGLALSPEGSEIALAISDHLRVAFEGLAH